MEQTLVAYILSLLPFKVLEYQFIGFCGAAASFGLPTRQPVLKKFGYGMVNWAISWNVTPLVMWVMSRIFAVKQNAPWLEQPAAFLLGLFGMSLALIIYNWSKNPYMVFQRFLALRQEKSEKKE